MNHLDEVIFEIITYTKLIYTNMYTKFRPELVDIGGGRLEPSSDVMSICIACDDDETHIYLTVESDPSGKNKIGRLITIPGDKIYYFNNLTDVMDYIDSGELSKVFKDIYYGELCIECPVFPKVYIEKPIEI